jgi:hypothetical protein
LQHPFLKAKGKQYLLITMDLFTKWPKVYIIPDQKAMTVVDVLVNNFFCSGVLRKLHRPTKAGTWRHKSRTLYLGVCKTHYSFASTVGWHDGTLTCRQNPCGGGVEYLHRDPASRKRRRNGAKKGRAIA